MSPHGPATPPLVGMPLPSQPSPGSTGGSSRIPAPFQPAPDSTGRSPQIPAPVSTAEIPRILAFLSSPGRSPRTPAPSRPVRGSTGGTPRIPTALSGPAVPREPVPRSSRQCTILLDWFLERVEGDETKIRVAGNTFTPQMAPHMRKGASSSKGKLSVAGRVFRSSAIVKRLNCSTIESEDGFQIRIGGCMNVAKTRENGFSEEVCECFEFFFPDAWQSLLNPKMVPDNEHEQSPSETTSAPGPSVEDYMAKFLSDDFSRSFRYDVPEFDFCSSVEYSGGTDGLTNQSLWNLPDDNAGNITASPPLAPPPGEWACLWGSYGLRTDVPEKPLEPPREACNTGQESYQHGSTQTDASKQEKVNHSISSVSVKQSTGSISSNSKVFGNILAPSKISSVVNEGYRSTVGCGQAEEDGDIQQENMHRSSSEHGMVTLPIDCTSSQLGEPGIPKSKSGNDSVNLGTTNAVELPTEGMTPRCGAIGGSEESTGTRLRNGKILGMPSGGRRVHKQKMIQLEASSKQMVSQGTTSTVDLTSHKNDFSAAVIVVEETLESHDSGRKGRGRLKGTGKRKRKRKL